MLTGSRPGAVDSILKVIECVFSVTFVHYSSSKHISLSCFSCCSFYVDAKLRFILRKIAVHAYLNHTHADVLTIMQFCVTLVILENHRCST